LTGLPKVPTNWNEQSKMNTALDCAETPLAFQFKLDALGPGATVILPPREFPGPIVINKPLILDGQGAVIWALRGPVVSIGSGGVALHNLKIEVTTEQNEIDDIEGKSALWVQPGASVKCENVVVRGMCKGLTAEEGEWDYPHSLEIGPLAHGVEHEFVMFITVPVKCSIQSNISGITLNPCDLIPGTNEIGIHIEHLPQDTLIHGSFLLCTTLLKRCIMVHGNVFRPQMGQIAVPILGKVIWPKETISWPNVFLRGQKERLDKLTQATTIRVETSISAPDGHTFDFFCLGLDHNAQLTDDRYMVFYNQKSSPCGGVMALPGHEGYLDSFQIDFLRLPVIIRKLVFAVAIDGPGTMSEINSGYVRMLDNVSEVVRYRFYGREFGDERAIILAEIYWKDVWRFSAVGQGYRGGIVALLQKYGWKE
jgi:stress response protein SCP2